jgi:hypothetical protein
VFVLRFSSGRTLKVQNGTVVTAEDFLGLGSKATDKAFAEVAKHPTDPRILGLKNLCGSAWSAPAPDGSPRKIEPGRSITLVDGLRIHFGSAVSTIREEPGGFVLGSPSGPGILLKPGRRLIASDVMRIRGAPGDPAAQVASHPTNPTRLGLKNLSGLSWSAVVPDGGVRSIEPGKSIELEHGTKLDFGFINAEIQPVTLRAWSKGRAGIQTWLPKSSHPWARWAVVSKRGILLVALIPLLAGGWFAMRFGFLNSGAKLGVSRWDAAAVARLDPVKTAELAALIQSEYERLPPAPSYALPRGSGAVGSAVPSGTPSTPAATAAAPVGAPDAGPVSIPSWGGSNPPASTSSDPPAPSLGSRSPP